MLGFNITTDEDGSTRVADDAIRVPMKEISGQTLCAYIGPMSIPEAERFANLVDPWVEAGGEPGDMPEELGPTLQKILSRYLRGWDAGLVGHNGEPVEFGTVVNGEPVQHYWIDYLVAHRIGMALKLCRWSAIAIGVLEGNSQAGAASTGDTDQDGPTDNQPSTVSEGPTIEDEPVGAPV